MSSIDVGQDTPVDDTSLFRPLRNRNFSLLFIGQSVSGLGNGMYKVILAWTVYNVTGSAADMSIVLIASIAPQFVFAIYGGILADRVSRRQVVLFSNFGGGLVTMALFLAVESHWVNAVYLVAGSFLLGMVSAFFQPAWGSIFKEILKPADLRAGNALRSVVSNAVQLVSPALGGLVFSIGGAGFGFALDAGSFFFATATVALTNVAPPPIKQREKLLREARDGFSYIFATSWLVRLIFISLAINTLCIAPMEVLLALLVRQSHQGSWFLGLALSVQACVAAFSAAAVGKWGGRARPGPAFLILAGLIACGVAILGLDLGQATILVGVVFVGVGFTFTVIEDTVMQKYVSNAYLGRVYSLGTLAAYSLLPVGYLFAGLGAARLGPGFVLLVGGALGMISIFLTYAVARHDSNSVLSDPLR